MAGYQMFCHSKLGFLGLLRASQSVEADHTLQLLWKCNQAMGQAAS